ncbi:putative reverse transcriptase domain-containing protein [Tanacetum coccineum]
MNGKTYRSVLCYRLGVPLFSVSKPCSACSRVFIEDIYGDHAISCAGIIGIKHRHNMVRDTLVDICFRSGISAGKEVDIGLDGGHDKKLRPADMLLYSWDGGLDVCVDLTGSSPLTQTGMSDFAPGRAVTDAAQRKRGKYMTKCADIGYGFLPFSFSSFGELEKDAVTLLKRVRNFSMAQDIGARAASHIFNRIGFSIAKGVGAQIVSRLPSNTEEQQKNQEEKKDEAGTGVGDKNVKGSESPTNENKQKDNKQNDNKHTAGVIVLGVHLHCQGCVETVVKSLRGFDGVEVVEPNTKDNRVTVKEKNCEPVKIEERVKRKSGKHVEIISPVHKKHQKNKPQEKKPEAPKVTEMVLKIHLHCEGCAKEVKHCILKMAGVEAKLWQVHWCRSGGWHRLMVAIMFVALADLWYDDSARLRCSGDSGYNVPATYVTLWAIGICLRNIRGYNMSM